MLNEVQTGVDHEVDGIAQQFVAVVPGDIEYLVGGPVQCLADPVMGDGAGRVRAVEDGADRLIAGTGRALPVLVSELADLVESGLRVRGDLLFLEVMELAGP
ncbi:hypothetical protein [Saccharopolyspora hattusasensis]|uniref:hypothetical protein n=1 Tax=Saccharopolyspora hattusasensis TaxID=1128679 RepID=UPI003D965D4D